MASTLYGPNTLTWIQLPNGMPSPAVTWDELGYLIGRLSAAEDIARHVAGAAQPDGPLDLPPAVA
jgi:hypothetical protein